MFSKFLVHVQSFEQTIFKLGHLWPSSFGMPSAQMSLAFDEPHKNIFHLIQIQTLPPPRLHKWKEVNDIVCKTANRKSSQGALLGKLVNMVR